MTQLTIGQLALMTQPRFCPEILSWLFRIQLGSNMNLTELLATQGYERIPLTRSNVGHLHTAGTLNARAVSVLLDTGGASSVLSLSLAREMGLTLTKLEMQ